MIGHLTLTLAEAAQELRVSKSTVRRLIRSKKLKSIPVAGRPRIRRYDLERYLQLATVTSGRAKAV